MPAVCCAGDSLPGDEAAPASDDPPASEPHGAHAESEDTDVDVTVDEHPEPATRKLETILLVEDDDAIRQLTGVLLRRNGYKVMEADSAKAAMDLFCRGREIHLLLADIVMPQMSGPELAGRLKSLHPSLPVVYMTGYSQHAIVQHGLADSNVPIITKPFEADQLLRAIRSTLDACK